VGTDTLLRLVKHTRRPRPTLVYQQTSVWLVPGCRPLERAGVVDKVPSVNIDSGPVVWTHRSPAVGYQMKPVTCDSKGSRQTAAVGGVCTLDDDNVTRLRQLKADSTNGLLITVTAPVVREVHSRVAEHQIVELLLEGKARRRG
jgi:hypothetical protein